jgi:ligand-binding SRPBCC domain-containing protein
VTSPYSLWVHEHTFEEISGGTLATDRVRYAVPGGRLANRLLVARDLRKTFEYRNRKIQEVFGSLPGEEEPIQIRRYLAEGLP